MNGQGNYENTWRMIQQMNEERLVEANRIHMAKVATSSKPRNTASPAQTPSPFSRFLYQAVITISAILWSQG